jgi:RNA polymerase sigma factor (sigma-70 family)
MLVRFLIRMTRCRAAAEDVAQMSWLKLIHARKRGMCRVVCDQELRAYLYEVARNTFIDEHTRKFNGSRTRPTDPGIVAELASRASSAPSAEEEIVRFDIGRSVERAVNALPAPQREIIAMWCADTSIAAMANQAAVPRDTVLSRKKYAFARLRAALMPVAPSAG